MTVVDLDEPTPVAEVLLYHEDGRWTARIDCEDFLVFGFDTATPAGAVQCLMNCAIEELEAIKELSEEEGAGATLQPKVAFLEQLTEGIKSSKGACPCDTRPFRWLLSRIWRLRRLSPWQS